LTIDWKRRIEGNIDDSTSSDQQFGGKVWRWSEEQKGLQNPGTPRFKIVCPENDDDIIEPNFQSRYHSGIGMLLYLYLIKYFQPDLCNVVREFSKSMDKATMGIYLEILRVLKLVIDTKTFCVIICPENKIKEFFDSPRILW
jgi:hypothetical protein